MGDNLVYAVRGSNGISMRRGFATDSSVLFEDSGTRAFEVAGGKEIVNADLKRTRRILFTPRDSYIVTYEPYVVYGPKVSPAQKPEPNMRVFSVADGKQVAELVASKEELWMPQFADDESIAVRLVGRKYDRKLAVQNVKVFAVSPGQAPLHVACYSPSSGVRDLDARDVLLLSTPGRVQIRSLDLPFTVVTAKNFFKTERATMQWNGKGTAVLVLSSTDVDASNQSYYGEQHVYLLNLSSGESFKVHLPKTGPVHAAKWSPNGREFCVCYGFMPAKASIYNLRGDEIFHTDEGPRNDVFYNAFGNILLTCGFGNLGKGKMEFWDAEKKKLIVSIEVPNTTLFEWAPDGQHFVTATTTPRLRIDNGFRMWHYSGKLVKEVMYDSPNEELWEVKFRPMSSYNKFEVKELTKAELECAGLMKQVSSSNGDTKSVKAVRSDTAYVPPHLRKDNQTTAGGESNHVKMTETEKKAFVIKKKLRDVGTLKARLAKGEELQQSQLEKIARESEFLAQLAALEGTQ
ncbi:eukaryotic translation initiation factor eIF2A [Teladorsagia circumcincta]|uniref:Eukaryotic translation initiation factor 2A n=1 Tax=Teladorsagia circumcincta TaxID=45464 RepID=A0A2G9URV8_TELCI|nr:eukaryotic translation initiation factor eIF2A [Teladorsagia circumcincta]